MTLRDTHGILFGHLVVLDHGTLLSVQLLHVLGCSGVHLDAVWRWRSHLLKSQRIVSILHVVEWLAVLQVVVHRHAHIEHWRALGHGERGGRHMYGLDGGLLLG